MCRSRTSFQFISFGVFLNYIFPIILRSDFFYCNKISFVLDKVFARLQSRRSLKWIKCSEYILKGGNRIENQFHSGTMIWKQWPSQYEKLLHPNRFYFILLWSSQTMNNLLSNVMKHGIGSVDSYIFCYRRRDYTYSNIYGVHKLTPCHKSVFPTEILIMIRFELYSQKLTKCPELNFK